MASVIVHHDGSYLEWSTARNKPLTTGMSRAEMRSRLIRMRHEPTVVDSALERAERHETSWKDERDPSLHMSIDALMAHNNAGGFDEHISPDEIVCRLLIDREPLR